MNQILVTKKLYITPELKRKKKIYKFYFMHKYRRIKLNVRTFYRESY